MSQEHNQLAPSLFLWKGELSDYTSTMSRTFGLDLPRFYRGYKESCPYCRSCYGVTEHEDDAWDHANITYRCPLCGFYYNFESFLVMEAFFISEEVTLSKLLTLDINDAQVGLGELGSHLKRRFADAQYLTSRRFEELVSDVFRRLGYYARLTQETRDGGYDIMLLERDSKEKCIVECKRYTGDNKVSVRAVRHLLGVQLAKEIRRAKLVTTTCFTRPATETANSVDIGASGYELELIDAGALLEALDLYNSELPPLWLEPRLEKLQRG